MWTFNATTSRSPGARTLLFAVLSGILVVGMGACDSGGSNAGNGENGDDGGNGETVAQTFSITVESIEDTDYAYSDQNTIGVAYAVDGEIGAEITLERGKTYAFALGDGVDSGPNNASHPFYVATSAEGGGSDGYDDGVENAGATSGTVTFTVPSGAPDELFYQCGSHVYMGGDISVIESSGDANSGEDDGGY